MEKLQSNLPLKAAKDQYSEVVSESLAYRRSGGNDFSTMLDYVERVCLAEDLVFDAIMRTECSKLLGAVEA